MPENGIDMAFSPGSSPPNPRPPRGPCRRHRQTPATRFHADKRLHREYRNRHDDVAQHERKGYQDRDHYEQSLISGPQERGEVSGRGQPKNQSNPCQEQYSPTPLSQYPGNDLIVLEPHINRVEKNQWAYHHGLQNHNRRENLANACAGVAANPPEMQEYRQKNRPQVKQEYPRKTAITIQTQCPPGREQGRSANQQHPKCHTESEYYFLVAGQSVSPFGCWGRSVTR